VAALVLVTALLLQAGYQLGLRSRIEQQEEALERCARVGTNVNRVPTTIAPSFHWYRGEVDRPADELSIGKAEGQDVIFTFALFSRYDVHHRQHATPSFDYIREWYDSLVWQQLRGVIFHDSFSSSFVREYECERIRFVNVHEAGFTDLLNSRLSLNDVRYVILEAYLRSVTDEITCAFVTDSWDVHFKHNPCTLVRLYPNAEIFVGNDNYAASTYASLVLAWPSCYPTSPFPAEKMDGFAYNPGVLGGLTAHLLRFLALLCAELKRTPVESDCNLLCTNAVLRSPHYQPDHIFTGYPLHSVFMGFEQHTEAAVIHK